MATRHLIIGGGTAGINAMRTIREEESTRSEITLVSAERPYSRMVLPYYLDRSIAESHVFTATAKVLADWGVKTHLGRRAAALDAKASVCTLDDGAKVEYDDCLIATGSSAVRAPVPGADGPGVHSFWTLDEARGVIAAIKPGSHVVMVGAGFIAFTILNSILSLGATLTIVELAPRILPRMIDDTGAKLVEDWLTKHGVTIRTGAGADLGQGRRARDRAHRPGARARRGLQHGRQGRSLPREPHHQHRRGLPPRRRLLRRLGRQQSGRGGGPPGRPAGVPQAPLQRRPVDRRDHPRPVRRH